MSEKTIKFKNIKVNKKEFHKSKQPIDLSLVSIKFHSEPVYDQTYIKTKVREFDGKIKTNFLGNDVPKENMHYACIAC